ncbi:MAG: DnaB-like helicase N-terminal domain-containing protein, partial [Gammaproteobacteria bacterium]
MSQRFSNISAVPQTGRVPPQAPEAEQSVLGGLLVDTRRWDEVADIVRSDDFYLRQHREIFGAIKALQEGGNPVDIVTASEWLKNQGTL